MPECLIGCSFGLLVWLCLFVCLCLCVVDGSCARICAWSVVCVFVRRRCFVVCVSVYFDLIDVLCDRQFKSSFGVFVRLVCLCLFVSLRVCLFVCSSGVFERLRICLCLLACLWC